MENNKELEQLAKFAVNLKHEFTTPMRTLVSTLEELQRSETDEQKKLQLDVALRNAYKYRALTNDIFAISNLLSGQVMFRMAKTDIVEFIKTVVSIFKPAANKRNVQLQFKSNVKEISGYIDYQKLYRILYRLIANGIRFAKSDGGIVQINFMANEEKGNFKIDVWDNGIGIIPEKVPHVFNLNYDADPIHLAHYQSTSIGLYFIKLLVQHLNGDISVASEKFHFTKFSTILPFFNNANEIPYKHIDVYNETNVENLLRMEEVLQVDTDEILQIKQREESKKLVVVGARSSYEPFWKMVFEEDAEMIFTNDVDKALGHILDFVPDIVILEEHMVDANGSETIQFLKRNSVVSHVPMALFCPDINENQAKKQAASCSADDYIIDIKNEAFVRQRLNNLMENRKKVYEAAFQKAVDEIKTTKTLSAEDSFLSRVNTIIDKHITEEGFNVDMLSNEMYMSRTQIHRKLKAISGHATTQYIKRFKLKKAFKALENRTGTISEIAYRFGFSSPAYFSRVFHDVYEKKPSDIIRNDK